VAAVLCPRCGDHAGDRGGVVEQEFCASVPHAATAAVAAALLDTCANVTMLLAIQKWMLSLASILISLYPATTVILAIIVLRERVTRWQAIGMALAAVSVSMIAAA
jgi:drug/metabolite transporter (DMT)-like permease